MENTNKNIITELSKEAIKTYMQQTISQIEVYNDLAYLYHKRVFDCERESKEYISYCELWNTYKSIALALAESFNKIERELLKRDCDNETKISIYGYTTLGSSIQAIRWNEELETRKSKTIKN